MDYWEFSNAIPYGLSALILWNYLARTSYEEEMKKALYTQRIAAYAYHRLKNLEEKLIAEHRMDQGGLWVGRSPLSLSICFKQVKREIASKYSLSREIYNIDGQDWAYNHIFAMGHVDEKSIERLIEDLSKPGAFQEPNPDNAFNSDSIILEMNPTKLNLERQNPDWSRLGLPLPRNLR